MSRYMSPNETYNSKTGRTLFEQTDEHRGKDKNS